MKSNGLDRFLFAKNNVFYQKQMRMLDQVSPVFMEDKHVCLEIVLSQEFAMLHRIVL